MNFVYPENLRTASTSLGEQSGSRNWHFKSASLKPMNSKVLTPVTHATFLLKGKKHNPAGFQSYLTSATDHRKLSS